MSPSAADVHAPAAPERGALARRRAPQRPVSSSQPASDALRLPVTGSSTAAAAPGRTRAPRGSPSARRRRRRRRRGRESAGLERQHRARASEQHAEPARAVVDPRRVDDAVAPSAEARQRLRRARRPRPGPERHQRRGGEREPAVGPPDRRSARRRTPGDRRARAPPAPRPGVAGPERRVPGERQLAVGGEDPHAVVGLGPVGGSTNVVSERFVQCAKRCISSVVRPSASSTTATGLPTKGVGGEDVDLGEGARAHVRSPARSGAARAPAPRRSWLGRPRLLKWSSTSRARHWR